LLNIHHTEKHFCNQKITYELMGFLTETCPLYRSTNTFSVTNVDTME